MITRSYVKEKLWRITSLNEDTNGDYRGTWPCIAGTFFGRIFDLYILMVHNLVPPNTKGKPSDLIFSQTLPSRKEAAERFKWATDRMQNPLIWHKLAGWASARFKLAGASGETLQGLARPGNFLRIDVPGPGPGAGEGYDWVKIEALESQLDPEGEEEWIGMKVRPSGNPNRNSMGTAHFFQSDASSTFIIQRADTVVTAFYHGRNEVPNVSTEKLTDNIRNALVATGAIISFSEAQWSALCRGFIQPPL